MKAQATKISPEQKRLVRAIAKAQGGSPAHARRIQATILNVLALFGGTIASVTEATR